jgi:hypothetical protein
MMMLLLCPASVMTLFSVVFLRLSLLPAGVMLRFQRLRLFSVITVFVQEGFAKMQRW